MGGHFIPGQLPLHVVTERGYSVFKKLNAASLDEQPRGGLSFLHPAASKQGLCAKSRKTNEPRTNMNVFGVPLLISFHFPPDPCQNKALFGNSPGFNTPSTFGLVKVMIQIVPSGPLEAECNTTQTGQITRGISAVLGAVADGPTLMNDTLLSTS